MLLSEMANKELIQLSDGRRMGFLSNTELLFQPKTGEIIGFELPDKKKMWNGSKGNASSKEIVLWSDIVLIGENRILFSKTTDSNKVSQLG
ncbi:YlmC/YmxH family sporulation protein [Paenisporosarcina cavernae]|uniref:YlmC/YmxH family sporulation protein n=1 Tax=Paenisporosarcina cavernae TaxID=2320858 RepID=A0A385YTN8_9BACL|nr:YlmC/YmxH family sporulation protein [Paenisporosarcina cavernae]AYC29287.1 YlmC/YmxH family sporulation protein [Paenisporosarcina cavernae]